MRRWAYFFAGGVLGAATSAVVNYLFAPAPETRFDETYQSRLDWAREEGEKAADAREQALRAQFEAAKQPKPPAPPLPPEMPPSFDSAAPHDFHSGGDFATGEPGGSTDTGSNVQEASSSRQASSSRTEPPFNGAHTDSPRRRRR